MVRSSSALHHTSFSHVEQLLTDIEERLPLMRIDLVEEPRPERVQLRRAVLERLPSLAGQADLDNPSVGGASFALHTTGVHETVYVGDMVLDVESAARAEVPVLLVRGGSSDDGQLDRTGERVLDSISELTDVFPG